VCQFWAKSHATKPEGVFHDARRSAYASAASVWGSQPILSQVTCTPTVRGPRGWTVACTTSNSSPVWSKNSCGFTGVVFQEPPEPFTTLNGTLKGHFWADRRKEQPIALALMIPLVMKMLHVLCQRMAE
jgi:hypothetical protein